MTKFSQKDLEQALYEFNPHIHNYKKAVQTIFSYIADVVKNGDEIVIRGFGKFVPGKTTPREVTPPTTGVPVKCPSRIRIKFKPSKRLKDFLNEGGD